MRKNIRGYEIQRQLATGGFSEVYVARQEMVNREVAIKVILPVHSNTAEFIRRFQYEAELIARLEHPHIVPLYDYWRDPQGAYLVMRYIRGGNLANKLTTDGAMPPKQAAQLLTQIASALAVAHRNRVVHQDIKPMNIMLDEDGNAYLTDFGIARDIEGNVNLAEDESNTMHGSPKYISPEHLRRRDVTPRSDIYSLGILMWEVLTGKPPFEHDDILKLLQMHVRNDLPLLEEFDPALPEQLNFPLRQATLKDPMQRYEHVMDFARDFNAIVTALDSDSTGTIPIPQLSDEDVEPTGPIEVINPYKGLSAFKESDAENFFGRSELIKRLMKAMTDTSAAGRFLAVVGPSGSGKSSVVRAGLIPALRRGEIMGLPTQYISSMIPGANPMRSLEGAILKVALKADVKLIETISKDEYDLNAVLQSSLPEDGEMLLVIDQFEEIFTLVADEGRRRTFLNMIYDALMTEDSRLRVIVTMRADFFDRPLQYSGWGSLFQDRLEPVPVMNDDELREAIEMPAENAGLDLQDGLSDVMINEISDQIGALPLLQYALTELYDRREGIMMTRKAYTKMKGIRGALTQRANEIYDTLDDKTKDVARLVFTRLVRVGIATGNDTRRRVLRGDLDSLDRNPQEIQTVLDVFGKYRLLTFDHNPTTHYPTVEIAHEALIGSWKTLSDWINDNRTDLMIQERLSASTRQWLDNGNDDSFLARGSQLGQYQALLKNDIIALTDDEHKFLMESIALQEAEALRQRRIQRIIATLGIVASIAAVIAFGLAFLANQLRLDAIEARDNEAVARTLADANANQSRARELAANALLFADTQPDRAMLLSLESLAVEITFEGENALLTSLLSDRRIQGFFSGHTESLRAVDVSTDGTLLATGSRTGAVIIWDAETRSILQRLTVLDERVNTVAFNADGTQLLVADGGGTVSIWDTATGEMIDSIVASDREVRVADFSPDGTRIVTTDVRGQVNTWSTEDYTQLSSETVHSASEIYALVFSADGSQMATGGEDGTIVVWDVEDDYRIETEFLAHNDWVLTLAFSPDGTRLASGSADEVVALWGVDGTNEWAFSAHDGQVSSVTFTDNGAIVISGGVDARVILWGANGSGVLTNFFTAALSEVRDLQARANTLYVASDATQLLEYSIGIQPRFGEVFTQANEQINTLTIQPETGMVAYAGGLVDDFGIYIMDTSDPDAEPTMLDFHTNIINQLHWHEEWLVSSSTDQTVVISDGTEAMYTVPVGDATFGIAMHDNTLAVGTNQGDIVLFTLDADSDTWSETGRLIGHSNRVSDLVFNADGTRLISGSRDGTVIVWDMASNEPAFAPLDGHTAGVNAIALSPDESIIASASRDTTIIFWDTATGEAIGAPLSRHENWVNDIAFSTDGTRLVSVSHDRTVILWDVASHRSIGMPYTGHANQVMSVDVNPVDDRLISADTNGVLFAWTWALDTWETQACAIVNRPINSTEQSEYFSDAYAPANVCQVE